jgi:hypothetical protein
MAAQMAAPAARYRGLTYSSCPYSKRRLATVPEPSQTPCHGRGSVVPMSGGVERNDWRPVGTWTVAVYRPRSHPDPTALVPARGASADCDHAVSYSANPAGPRNRPANTATHPAPTGHRLLPALQIDRTYSQLGVVGAWGSRRAASYGWLLVRHPGGGHVELAVAAQGHLLQLGHRQPGAGVSLGQQDRVAVAPVGPGVAVVGEVGRVRSLKSARGRQYERSDSPAAGQTRIGNLGYSVT